MKFYLNNKLVKKSTLEKMLGKKELSNRIASAQEELNANPYFMICWDDGVCMCGVIK